MIDYGQATPALEIVADHEAEFNKQWDALAKINFRVEVAGLRRVWSAQLARTARVKRVEQPLLDLLLGGRSRRKATTTIAIGGAARESEPLS